MLFLPVATRGRCAGKLGAAVSSAHPGVQWGRGSAAGLDAEVLAQRGSHGDADKPHFASTWAVTWVLSFGPSWGPIWRSVLGPHLCLCVVEGAQRSLGEDCAPFCLLLLLWPWLWGSRRELGGQGCVQGTSFPSPHPHNSLPPSRHYDSFHF